MATAKELISKAASQIGVKESPAGSNRVKYWDFYKERTGKNFQGSPWCAAFVTWCMAQVGLWDVKSDKGMYRYCPSLVNYAKEQKQWLDRSVTPKAGDIVLFANKGVACHVGFVEKVLSNGNLQTIEGNTSVTSNDNGGAVMRRTRAYGNVGTSWYVLGFMRPKFSSTSSDTSSSTSSSSSTKGTKYTITASSLNVRKGAGTNYAKVTSYAKGKTVTVTETKTVGSDTWGKTSDGWIAIKYQGNTYAKKASTSAAAPSPSKVKYTITASSGVNVRKGAGTQYARVTGYPKGKTVTVTETKVVNGNTWGKTSDGWFAIKYNGSSYAKKA